MVNNSNDPLEAVLNRQRAALNGEPVVNETTAVESSGKGLMDLDIDDEYGNNDLENVIREEEDVARLEREKAYAEKQERTNSEIKTMI